MPPDPLNNMSDVNPTLLSVNPPPAGMPPDPLNNMSDVNPTLLSVNPPPPPPPYLKAGSVPGWNYSITGSIYLSASRRGSPRKSVR